MLFIGFSISFSTIWYLTYYRARYLRQTKNSQTLKVKLYAEFEVTDDLKYVSLKISQEIKSYLKRNQVLYQAINNPNYQNTRYMLEELEFIVALKPKTLMRIKIHPRMPNNKTI
ncbi:hypothetical protein [Spiroplasma endosymbiont of Polydrusus formosus]|uniref:hypothetical protein n=1 Tax=Spiroplasma endosymbiont of Polydrusus formosus TaxID=3139326 RepID=UPI0035B50A88